MSHENYFKFYILLTFSLPFHVIISKLEFQLSILMNAKNTDLFKRVIETDDCKTSSSLVEVNFSDIDYSKPIFLCFPGSVVSKKKNDLTTLNTEDYLKNIISTGSKYIATDEAYKALNGFIKQTERLIGSNEHQVFGIIYDNDEQGLKNHKANNYNKPETYFSPQAEKIVNDILSPLFINENSPDKKYSKDELTNNFSKLKIISYSHGSIFAADVNNALISSMVKHGYRYNQVYDALGNANLVAIGATMSLQKHKSSSLEFQSVLFTAVNDKVIYPFNKNGEKNSVRKISDKAIQVYTENPLEFYYLDNCVPHKHLKDETFHNPLSYSAFKFSKSSENEVDNLTPFMIKNAITNMFSEGEKDITKILTHNSQETPKSFYKRLYNERVENIVNKVFGSNERV